MSAHHTCTTCSQEWVLTFAKATPGRRVTDQQPTRVPVTNVDGRTTGYEWQSREHWDYQGDPQPLTHDDGDGFTGHTTWPCGDHRASVDRVLVDRVACLSCRPRESGPWWKVAPAACGCCGVSRRHPIPRILPADWVPPLCGASVATP